MLRFPFACYAFAEVHEREVGRLQLLPLVAQQLRHRVLLLLELGPRLVALRAPTFEEASFPVEADGTVTITMIYL